MAERAIVRTRIRPVQIGDNIVIDACREETHTLANTITDHPVEQGFNISDHVRPEPDVLTLTCFISNTPLSREQQSRAVREGSVQFETSAQEGRQIGAVGGRGEKAFERLKKLRDEGTLVSIYTNLRNYGVTQTEGMVIQSLTIPRTRENFDGLEFSITFKQVRIVRNRQTTVPRSTDKRVPPKQKQGAKVPKEEEIKSNAFRVSETAAESGNSNVSGFGNFMLRR